jgi:hypothetical protein
MNHAVTPGTLFRSSVTRSRFAILMLACLAPCAATALGDHDWLDFQQGTFATESPGLEPDRRETLDALEHGFVDLVWSIEFSREGDNIVEHFRLVRHFLTFDGIESGGELEISVAPSRDHLTIEAAESLRADGRRFLVDPLTIQVQDDTRPRIFSDVKNVTVPCPSLDTGSTCMIEYTRRTRTRDWPMPWATGAALQSGYPIERIEIVAEGLDEETHWSTTDLELACEEGSGRVVCTKTLVEPLQPDLDLGLVRDQIPTFSFGERKDWQSVAVLVRDLVEREVIKGIPAGTADRILATAQIDPTDEQATWNEIFRFAADEIRYLGFEQGRNAVVPHPPATTLERRFGDCKDKVTLLIALARQAGLDAYPVLVATDRYSNRDVDFASSNYFDHMVVCSTTNSGETICADPTLTNALPEDSALAVAGRLALPLRAETRAPELLPSPEFASRIELERRSIVHCDGSTRIESRRALVGEARIRFRAQYANVEPSVRRRFLMDEHKQVLRSTLSPGIEIESFHDRTQPLSINAEIEIEGDGSLADDYVAISHENWLVHYAMGLRPANLHYPVRISGLEIVSRQIFEVCNDFALLHHGALLEMETEFGRLVRNYERRRDEVRVETRFEFPRQILAVDDFEHVNHFLTNALEQTTIWLEHYRK